MVSRRRFRSLSIRVGEPPFNSGKTPTAPSTPQQIIMEALEKVITAINQADVSEQEKNEAKTLLRRLLGSKAAVSVLGLGAQSLTAKYFTE